MTTKEGSTSGSISVSDFLELNAEAALDLQHSDGSFPPSRNGVYDQNETLVRTTSYWLAVLCEVYERTERDIFRDAANHSANYLLSDEARPYGHTYHSRSVKGKDRCDGLVGQSGPIRGLGRAGRILNRPELIETARNVFDIHPFCSEIGLWERVEITGERLSFDRTLNHQITFAATAAELIDEYEYVNQIVERFLNLLPQNVTTHESGIFRHLVEPSIYTTLRYSLSNKGWNNLLWNEVVTALYRVKNLNWQKEKGYHLTNIVWLALLKGKYPNHAVWENRKIQNAISVFTPNEEKKQLKTNNLKFGSVLPYIDKAIVFEQFGLASKSKITNLLSRCISNKYDSETGLLTQNAEDPMIQAASISRLIDMPNYDIPLRSSLA